MWTLLTSIYVLVSKIGGYCIYDASGVWSSCGKLGHILWKLFLKRTGQEHSGQDDVNHDFKDTLRQSQSGQEDRRLPEKALAYWQQLRFCSCVVPETASAYLQRQHLCQGYGVTCGRFPGIFQTSTLST